MKENTLFAFAGILSFFLNESLGTHYPLLTYEESMRTLMEEMLISGSTEIRVLLFSYSFVQNDSYGGT